MLNLSLPHSARKCRSEHSCAYRTTSARATVERQYLLCLSCDARLRTRPSGSGAQSSVIYLNRCFPQARRCILVAASPEILCRVDSSRTITNRPLAGTRRRGATPAEDAELAQDLLDDEKEKAEHIMLVDLGRNDVGKVAVAGSVHVDRLMTIERYSHVMHISSSVSGARQNSCVLCSSVTVLRVPSCAPARAYLHAHCYWLCVRTA